MFGRLGLGWIAKLIATAFLLIATMIFIGAESRSAVVVNRLHAHKVQSEKVNNMRVITIASIAARVALIAAIWLLKYEPPATR